MNGHNRRITIGLYGKLSLEDARREARKILSDMGKGIDPIGEREQQRILKVTLADVLDKYLDSRTSMLDGTKLGYRKKMKQYLGDWLDKPVTSITPEMVVQRHRELGNRQTRCKTDGKATANAAMEVLRVVLAYAADNYRVCGKPLFDENPVERLTLNRQWFPRHPRQGVIPDNRMKDWYQATMQLDSKIARDYFLLLIFTGLRRREAAKLKWSDVDFEEMTLNIPQTKNGKMHRLPLSEFLATLLKTRLPSDSEYVFPGRFQGSMNEPRQPWARLRSKLKLNFLIHDLRRTYLTTGEKLGVSHYTLKKLANHSIQGGKDVTGGYIVVNVEMMREPMNQITNRLLELMGTSLETWQEADSFGITREVAAGTQTVEQRDPEQVYFHISFSTNH